jgi:hypothetical protein
VDKDPVVGSAKEISLHARRRAPMDSPRNIARLNVEHYRRLLATEADPIKRATAEKMLADKITVESRDRCWLPIGRARPAPIGIVGRSESGADRIVLLQRCDLQTGKAQPYPLATRSTI